MLEQDLRRVVLAGSNYALERDLKKQSCLFHIQTERI